MILKLRAAVWMGFRYRLLNQDDGTVLISSTRSYPIQSESREALRHAVIQGLASSNYKINSASNGQIFFNIMDGDSVVARRIELFDSEIEAETEIAKQVSYLRERYSVEGMYLVENILLQPIAKSDKMIDICVDSNCEDCHNLDPYSYRIQIVLPAFGERFRDMEYRQYAESVIRAETPSWILPKICWAGREDMREMESSYVDWLRTKAGSDTSDRQNKLERFLTVLSSIKSTYPSERLIDCADTEEHTRFIVGRTILGSTEPHDT